MKKKYTLDVQMKYRIGDKTYLETEKLCKFFWGTIDVPDTLAYFLHQESHLLFVVMKSSQIQKCNLIRIVQLTLLPRLNMHEIKWYFNCMSDQVRYTFEQNNAFYDSRICYDISHLSKSNEKMLGETPEDWINSRLSLLTKKCEQQKLDVNK